MEENQQDRSPSFNSPDAQKEEIRIAMWSVEENIKKLYEASRNGFIQSLRTLIQEDPNLIQKILTSTSDNESPLHMSISHGHLEFTRLLLDHKPELATEVDAFQRTPLHLASKHGDMETIQALLEKNTSACLVYDKNGLIPLHYAVISGQIKIMQKLINVRPQSIWMKLNNGQTILHLCVESNHLEGIKLFIETIMNHDEAFINTTDDKGNTILDLSIMLRQSEMVGYLLSIPEVKARTSTANFAASDVTKERPKFQKTKARKPKRQRRESASLSTNKTIGYWRLWRKNLKYKENWIQEVHGTMMLVATVIATVAFQATINPPGGVWQQDTQYNSNNYINQYYQKGLLYKYLRNGTIFPAGTAIMAYQKRVRYLVYLLANMVSFLASVSVILLIISRLPLKNRVGSWVMVVAMCVAVVFFAIGYLLGVTMVNSHAIFGDKIAYTGYVIAFSSWYGMIFLVGLFHIIRFLVWVVNILFRTFTSKLKSHSFNVLTP